MFKPVFLSNSGSTSRSTCLSLLLLLVVRSQVASAQTLTFTQQQVDAGKATYREVCQICHGSSLANGQFGTPLKGSFFTDKWKGKSLAELVTFVFEKMPPDNLKSLAPEQYVNAVAYILARNEIAAADAPMASDIESLGAVMLPW